VIAVDGLTVGHVLISAITRGAADSGAIGYWIAERFAGRGIAPAAVAAAFDHAVGPAGLHRVEALIHEDNAPSLAVMAKLGFRDEGVRRGCLHVGREWVDHRVFALTREDVPEGLVVRWGGGG
jgi:ribosomal-protein-alanine N-acetyltransferase